MKKKWMGAALALLLALSAAGCKKAEPTPTPTPEPTATVTPTDEPTPEPTDAGLLIPGDEVPEGISPTTGKQSTQPYKPIFVSIGNTVDARPYWNLAQADIIYEILMEGQSITRYVALYNDELPETVGSVRSSRVVHANIISEWEDAALVFAGGTEENHAGNPYNRMAQYGIDKAHQINALKGDYTGLFWREKVRKAPHNCVTDLTKVAAELEENDNRDVHFRFSHEPSQGTESAVKVSVTYTPTLSRADAVYVYDEQTGLYKRTVDGQAAKDFSGAELTCDNLIVQHMKYQVVSDYGHLDCNNIGSGDAEIFINGKVIHGTWERKSAEQRTVYRDQDGNEINFTVGKTWVNLVKDEGKIDIQ